MRLLLTSAGISNPAIRAALVDLLGRPIAESHALCIPTAGHGSSFGPVGPWRFLRGADLGWKSVGVLELTALPSIDRDRWVEWVRQTDVLLVNGGDVMYLDRWMRESGLAELLPSLPELVWVGFSAGSLVLTPRVGREFADRPSAAGGDRTLGVVDFSLFPHLDHPDLPDNSMAAAERWAAGIAGPAYAIDDDTAITVVDGTVDVVSEGHWTFFAPAP